MTAKGGVPRSEAAAPAAGRGVVARAARMIAVEAPGWIGLGGLDAKRARRCFVVVSALFFVCDGGVCGPFHSLFVMIHKLLLYGY